MELTLEHFDSERKQELFEAIRHFMKYEILSQKARPLDAKYHALNSNLVDTLATLYEDQFEKPG